MALVDFLLDFISRNITSVFIFIILFLLGYLTLLTRSRHSNLPPGPRRLPIIGNLLDIRKGDPRNIYKELRDSYGDIFSFQIFEKLFIVVNGYDTLKELFVKEGDKTSDRFNSELFQFSMGHNVTGVLFASGQRWKHNRRFCLHHLRNFGMGKSMIQTQIQTEAEKFMNEIDRQMGRPFDIKNLIHNASSNVICSILFGHRFEYDDDNFKLFIRRLDENISSSGTNSLFLKPVLRYVPGDPFKAKRIINNTMQNFKFIKGEVERHRTRFTPGVINDIIDAYLDEWGRAEETGDTDFCTEELERLCGDLFVAGTETTATTMRWFLIYIMQNPDVQQKIQAEIDEHIPTDRLPTMEDKPRLVNMEAAILETLRLSTLLPLSLPHRAAEDFEFKGYKIPTDAYLLPNLHSVLFDEQLFPNADKFDPSRFIDREKKIRSMDEHIPFSIGRRICLGESLARMELFLFLSALLQRFEILPPEGSPPPPSKGTLGVTHGPYPFLMRVAKRH